MPFSRRDYLRGVIDADGSVGYTSMGLPFISLTTASAAIGAYLCHYAKKVTGMQRIIKRNARDNIYNISYEKEAAQELAAHLYYPGCMSLDRKHTAAAALSEWVRPADMKIAPPRRGWKAWEDRVLLKHSTPAAAAEELGRTEQSCFMRLWRLKTGQVPLPPEENADY